MFRPMRRKEKESGMKDAKKLLHDARRGILAVNGDNNYPVFGNETVKEEAWAPFLQSVVRKRSAGTLTFPCRPDELQKKQPEDCPLAAFRLLFLLFSFPSRRLYA